MSNRGVYFLFMIEQGVDTLLVGTMYCRLYTIIIILMLML